VRGESRPELRVGHHTRVPDPVDGLEAVADPDGVDAPPGAAREHSGVDLEMQMPVRVTGPGGEVAYDGGFDLLHRHLHLPAPRPYPGCRMRRQPTDDLLSSRHLRGVICLGNLRVQRRRERPRLRPVDGDLDEPHRLIIGSEPAFRCPGFNVVPGDPPLVGLAVHVVPVLEAPGCGDDPHRNAAALGEVVVVGPGSVGLDVVPRGGRRSPVDLHAAVH